MHTVTSDKIRIVGCGLVGAQIGCDKSLPWKLKLQQLLRDLVKDKRIKHTVKLWLKLNTHKHIVLLMMLLPKISTSH